MMGEQASKKIHTKYTKTQFYTDFLKRNFLIPTYFCNFGV